MCFTLLGIYLLGKIRFKYDSPVEYISVGRLALVIIDFAFVVYMLPGMWGAPLKALSGYLPPLETQDFVIVSLYVDDKAKLPESQWVTNNKGKVLKDVGRVNSQPNYFILDQEGHILSGPRRYSLDIGGFVRFLDLSL